MIAAHLSVAGSSISLMALRRLWAFTTPASPRFRSPYSLTNLHISASQRVLWLVNCWAGNTFLDFHHNNLGNFGRGIPPPARPLEAIFSDLLIERAARDAQTVTVACIRPFMHPGRNG